MVNDYSYFENMERLFHDEYIPSATDVLRARVRTNGVIETHFRIHGIQFRSVEYYNKRAVNFLETL